MDEQEEGGAEASEPGVGSHHAVWQQEGQHVAERPQPSLHQPVPVVQRAVAAVAFVLHTDHDESQAAKQDLRTGDMGQGGAVRLASILRPAAAKGKARIFTVTEADQRACKMIYMNRTALQPLISSCACRRQAKQHRKSATLTKLPIEIRYTACCPNHASGGMSVPVK